MKEKPFKVELEPFQSWLKVKLVKYETIDNLSSVTGIPRRRIECYLRGKQYDKRIKDPTIREISIDIPDAALINEWSTNLWELYPNLYE